MEILNFNNMANAMPIYFKMSKKDTQNYEITGAAHNISAGDVIELNALPMWNKIQLDAKVTAVLERRDCAGNWKDKNNSKGTFFKACIELITDDKYYSRKLNTDISLTPAK